jgi:UvrD-like helicase family protein
LKRHQNKKPILVLTHTNAGVAALRVRLNKAGVKSSSYALITIDGWAMRLTSTFPMRAEINQEILKLINPRADYPNIRHAAITLLQGGHIQDILAANYSYLIVDEYQDCSILQHSIVSLTAKIIPTCVLGDPLQAIFGFGQDGLADWEGHVCTQFPVSGELSIPWRWKNQGTDDLGEWLLESRKYLELENTISY